MACSVDMGVLRNHHAPTKLRRRRKGAVETTLARDFEEKGTEKKFVRTGLLVIQPTEKP